jgi:hypothetical protein
VMTDGNWRLGVYVDDQASDEQLDKLVKVFSLDPPPEFG